MLTPFNLPAPPSNPVQSSPAPAFARAAPNTSYQEELLASVKARGGSGLPSLTASPAVEAPKAAEKKSAPVAAPQKTVAAPTPRPSINGKELPADAPTIKLPEAPKTEATASVGSFASYTSTPAKSAPKAAAKSEEQGNNNAVVLGGVVLVAIAGVAVAGGNNGEGAEGGMAAAPAAAAPAAAATDADDEVKKVQAWIAAYKKRSGMA